MIYLNLYMYIGFDDAPPVDHIQEMHNFVETIVFDTTGETFFYIHLYLLLCLDIFMYRSIYFICVYLFLHAYIYI
jgi:hypothetical protein